jgi:hypothetical protein
VSYSPDNLEKKVIHFNTEAFGGMNSDDRACEYWIGCVKSSEDGNFGASGDSGSLVYAKEGDTTILLGIHVGKMEEEKLGIFICMEIFAGASFDQDFQVRFH